MPDGPPRTLRKKYHIALPFFFPPCTDNITAEQSSTELWHSVLPVTKGKTLGLDGLSIPGGEMAFVCVTPNALSLSKKGGNPRIRPRKSRVF